jgi:hypothetical protein
MFTKERLLHPATIIAVIALLVALSGAGYAATTIGTAQLKNNAVTTPKIKSAAVTTAKLKNNAVNSSKLASGAVRAADLGNGAVTGPKIADDAVTAARIANGAVGTTELAAGAVDGSKLRNGSVGTNELAPNAVTGAKIAGGTITAANIAPGQVITGKGQLFSGRLVLPLATGPATLLAMPGVATFAVDCTATGANTTVTNDSNKAITATAWGVDAGAVSPFAVQTPLALGAPTTLSNAGASGVQTATWQLAHGTGNTLHVTTVQVTAGGTAPGPGCAVSAQALTTD